MGERSEVLVGVAKRHCWWSCSRHDVVVLDDEGDYDATVRLLGEAVDEACAPVAAEAWRRVQPLIAALYSDAALDAYPRPDVAALIRQLRSGRPGPQR